MCPGVKHHQNYSEAEHQSQSLVGYKGQRAAGREASEITEDETVLQRGHISGTF